MITRSLSCFRGISPVAESKLWRAGCLSWDGVTLLGKALSERKRLDVVSQLPLLRAALDGRVADVFVHRFPVGQRLRILPEFAGGARDHRRELSALVG